jgi:hypothetical protein
MWMKNEHSWMNFIHDHVNNDTSIDVGDDVKNDNEHDVDHDFKDVIYDSLTISYL